MVVEGCDVVVGILARDDFGLVKNVVFDWVLVVVGCGDAYGDCSVFLLLFFFTLNFRLKSAICCGP